MFSNPAFELILRISVGGHSAKFLIPPLQVFLVTHLCGKHLIDLL